MTTRGAALVTGAGRRIGQVLALEAARAGYDVAIHYRASADEAEDTARAVRDLGRRALLVRADLADEDETRSLAAQAAPLGPLTLLINNASACRGPPGTAISRPICARRSCWRKPWRKPCRRTARDWWST